MRWKVRALKQLAACSAALTAVALTSPQTPKLPNISPAGYVLTTVEGIDACDAPSVSQMQAFYSQTPYGVIGIYIGGNTRGCPNQTYLNSQPNWVGQVISQGWKVLPIWVGPQAPCGPYNNKFSSDPSTANGNGRSEGGGAYNAMLNLGMSTNQTPIVYDMESYSANGNSCTTAAQSFVSGWDAFFDAGTPQTPGVYGSTSGSGLTYYASSNPAPSFIWGALYNNVNSTTSLPPVPDNAWNVHQRFHQFDKQVSRTYNHVTLTVDEDASDGPAYYG